MRTAVVYFAIVILLRLFGKRELAQLNSFDLVVLLLLSNVVQNAIIGPDTSLLGGLVGAGTLLFLNMVVVRIVRDHLWLNAQFYNGNRARPRREARREGLARLVPGRVTWRWRSAGRANRVDEGGARVELSGRVIV